MSEVGITKEFDKLGRIVIPKELRIRYGLDRKYTSSLPRKASF